MNQSSPPKPQLKRPKSQAQEPDGPGSPSGASAAAAPRKEDDISWRALVRHLVAGRSADETCLIIEAVLGQRPGAGRRLWGKAQGRDGNGIHNFRKAKAYAVIDALAGAHAQAAKDVIKKHGNGRNAGYKALAALLTSYLEPATPFTESDCKGFIHHDPKEHRLVPTDDFLQLLGNKQWPPHLPEAAAATKAAAEAEEDQPERRPHPVHGSSSYDGDEGACSNGLGSASSGPGVRFQPEVAVDVEDTSPAVLEGIEDTLSRQFSRSFSGLTLHDLDPELLSIADDSLLMSPMSWAMTSGVALWQT